ncbi:TetR/AcrR family transcriptional regulator, partial [candidate division CSSED10-310 bacterium]
GSAQKLFAERDFKSVTVREIARRAGLSPGTIYLYYKNLDELLLDIFLAHTRKITTLVDLERTSSTGCSIPRFYIQYLNEHMSFYQMMAHFMLGGKLAAPATEKLNTIIRDLISQLEGIIREVKNTRDNRLVAHALFSALNGIMISYARYPGRNLAEIQQHTLKLAGVIGEIFCET